MCDVFRTLRAPAYRAHVASIVIGATAFELYAAEHRLLAILSGTPCQRTQNLGLMGERLRGSLDYFV